MYIYNLIKLRGLPKICRICTLTGFLPYSRNSKKKKKTDGDEERDRELNDGVIVHSIFIVDNQDDAKGDACTDKSETASLISNTKKQETGTKPEANPEATRNGPIAKRVVCDLNTTKAFPNVLDLKCSPIEPILISAAAPRGHSFRGAEQVSSPRC